MHKEADEHRPQEPDRQLARRCRSIPARKKILRGKGRARSNSGASRRAEAIGSPIGQPTNGARRRRREFIEEEEGATNRLRGPLGHADRRRCAVVMSLFHLYAAYDIVPAHVLRAVHVGFVLVACLPAASRSRRAFATASCGGTGCCARLGVAMHRLHARRRRRLLATRNTLPTTVDMFFGVALMLLVLEACAARPAGSCRSSSSLFLAYALVGRGCPAPWTHRGYDVARLVGHLYMTLEGIFGPRSTCRRR